MAKKMARLDESPDFRPFKFRIQAFTNGFVEEVCAGTLAKSHVKCDLARTTRLRRGPNPDQEGSLCCLTTFQCLHICRLRPTCGTKILILLGSMKTERKQRVRAIIYGILRPKKCPVSVPTGLIDGRSRDLRGRSLGHLLLWHTSDLNGNGNPKYGIRSYLALASTLSSRLRTCHHGCTGTKVSFRASRPRTRKASTLSSKPW